MLFVIKEKQKKQNILTSPESYNKIYGFLKCRKAAYLSKYRKYSNKASSPMGIVAAAYTITEEFF